QAPPPSAPAATLDKAVGRVTRSEPGEVIISLGLADGVGRGNHLELTTPSENESDDAELSRDTLAVGVVTNVSEHSARVRLGLTESVPVGAVALPTIGQVTGSLAAPPRASRLWELQLFARPF